MSDDRTSDTELQREYKSAQASALSASQGEHTHKNDSGEHPDLDVSPLFVIVAVIQHADWSSWVTEQDVIGWCWERLRLRDCKVEVKYDRK